MKPKRMAIEHMQPGMLYSHTRDGLYTVFLGVEHDPEKIDRAWGVCEVGSYRWREHRNPDKLWIYIRSGREKSQPYWIARKRLVWAKEDTDGKES